MSFLNLARSRYSSRKYEGKPVSDGDLEYVLEAGRVAPSACNSQPWMIFAATSKEQRVRIHECYPASWFRTAPVILVICGDHNRSWVRTDGKDHCDIDVAILADHMTLAATDLGLATCWICAFDKKKCGQALGLPANMEPIVILSLGHPADEVDMRRHDRQRKSLEQIVKRDF